MRFIDEVEIVLRAGNGGNGCRSFLRERGRPMGGPDGGNGGKGGSIIFEAVPGKHTLLDLHFSKHYSAENGKNGQGKNRHGRSGGDRTVQVPVGTLARDKQTGEILKDLNRPGQRFVAARGGKGGRGNAQFTSPTRRTPDFSEDGLPGETLELRCELKLLADVGLVGLPNAGKSTLISSVSAARPKIADYPFTTLIPQLGMVRLGDETSFVIADIPGIISGASQGAGLGLRFLRHIERSSVLLFLIDLSCPEQEDPLQVYRLLLEELENFSPELLKKDRILAFNKVDLPVAAQRMEAMTPPDDIPVFFVSAVRKEGLKPLVRHLARCIKDRDGETLSGS
jgi:GTP-binding protein